MNQVVYQTITMVMDYKDFLPENRGTKDYIDYLVAFVLILAFGRFFLLFLVVPSISKMLLTIITMLIDVMPFAFIMVCYILFSTQFFSTLYQDIIQDKYGTLFFSFRQNFDNALAVYDHIGA